jgi:enoyl-CoA hydratase
MEYVHILFEKKDGVATITFNRPTVLNALNSALLEEFSHALAQIENDEAVRVLVLTGAGEKAFVAGADIRELAALSPLKAKHFAQKGQDLLDRLQALPIPVIAAVNGFALGGGTEIAMACDFIYAADTAVFGQPEINLGLIPGFGGTQRLPRRINIGRAKELIFTGEKIKAAEAVEMGLANKVLPAAELMAAVMETALLLAAKGRVALRAAKEAVNAGLDVDLHTGCRIERDAFALCMASPDAKEGTSAFLEKRPAAFSGGYHD